MNEGRDTLVDSSAGLYVVIRVLAVKGTGSTSVLLSSDVYARPSTLWPRGLSVKTVLLLLHCRIALLLLLHVVHLASNLPCRS
jgi:hypothetical protein